MCIRDRFATPKFSVNLLGSPLNILIIDSGSVSQTKAMVEQARLWKEANLGKWDNLYKQADLLVKEASQALEGGDLGKLGQTMTANHQLLQELGVSTPGLDELVNIALQAGALGAKLTGGGGGGSVITLVDEARKLAVKQALEQSGHLVWDAVISN